MLKIMADKGMPYDLVQSKYFDPNFPSLIVFDDLMRTVMNTAVDLFTEIAHHHNISVVLIIQNSFFQNKQCRIISVNAQYFILLKTLRDRLQVETFSRQVYLRKPIFLLKLMKEQP